MTYHILYSTKIIYSNYVKLESRPEHHFLLDLFGPSYPLSVNSRKYTLEVIGDFSRFTRAIFIFKKKETLEKLPALLNKLSNQKEPT